MADTAKRLQWINKEVTSRFNERTHLRLDTSILSPQETRATVEMIAERAHPETRPRLRELLLQSAAKDNQIVVKTWESAFAPPRGVMGTILGNVVPGLSEAARAIKEVEVPRTTFGKLTLPVEATKQFLGEQIETAGSPLGLATTPLPKAPLGLLGKVGAPLFKGLAKVAEKSPLGALVPLRGVPEAAKGAFQARREYLTAKLPESLELARKATQIPEDLISEGDRILRVANAAREEASALTRAPQRTQEAVEAFGGLLGPRERLTMEGVSKEGVEAFMASRPRSMELQREMIETGMFPEPKPLDPWYIPRFYLESERIPVLGGTRSVASREAPVTAAMAGRAKGRAPMPIPEKGPQAGLPFALAKGLSQETYAVANRRLHNELARDANVFTRDAAEALQKGWLAVEDNPRLWGPLAKGWMEPNTHRELTGMMEAAYKAPEWMRHWKGAKTVLNLPVHWANIASNFFMNHASGIPLWRVDLYAKAAKEMRTGGALFKEAQRGGLLGGGEITGELKDFLEEVLRAESLRDGQVPDLALELYSRIATSNKKSFYQRAANVYQGEESFFKMAKFIHEREKGKNVADAIREANKWLFDYSDVTRGVRRVRSSAFGLPFITYTVKAVPRMVEVAMTNPRVFATWNNLLRGWNVAAANQIGLDLREVDAFVKEEANLRRQDSLIGGAASVFDELAPMMVLPIRDRNGLPFVVRMARFVPLGQIFNPRQALGFAPGITVPMEMASGRRLFGSELGSRFAPEFPTHPEIGPEAAKEQMKRALGGRATELVSSGIPALPQWLLGPARTARVAEALAPWGSPMLPRAIQALLTEQARGEQMSGEGRGPLPLPPNFATNLRMRMFPFSMPTTAGAPPAGPSSMQQLIGSLAVTPQKLDLHRLKVLGALGKQRAMQDRMTGGGFSGAQFGQHGVPGALVPESSGADL